MGLPAALSVPVLAPARPWTPIAVRMASALAASILAFTAAAGLTGSMAVAAVVAVATAAAVAWRLGRRPLVAADERVEWRGLAAVAAAATVVALVLLFRVAVFMVSPSHVGFSNVPGSAWEVQHSCLSAYFVAAREATHVDNIYDKSLYSAPTSPLEGARRTPLKLDGFNIDAYEYPPPFLLLPRLLRVVAPDFLSLRMLWFALNGAVVLIAIVAVARSLSAPARTYALLLVPLVWSLNTSSTMQKGNVQLMVVAMAMAAMLLFERGHEAAGGALLAFAVVSKLYPGLLVVYLLARGRWRAVAWTAAFSAVLVALTLADVGWTPFAAFLQHLPGLLGGEAFPALRNPRALAINTSIPGLVFKAKLFGVPGMTFAAAKLVGWLYTLVALAATVWAARRAPRAGRDEALLWLTVIILATLRSPFLPQDYAFFPPVWLLTLLAATAAATRRTLLLLLAGWAALSMMIPLDTPTIGPRAIALLHALPQALTVALAVIALRRVRGLPEAPVAA